MESKYYTPTIEEFYVGFECEFFNRMTNKIWEPITCNVDDVQMAYDSNEHGSDAWEDSIQLTFRVKYLDKQDIESLGFELYEAHKITPGSVREIPHGFDEAFRISLLEDRFKGATINVDYTTHEVYIWYGNWNSYIGRVVFQGIIKNKSELVKVLKMIGVL